MLKMVRRLNVEELNRIAAENGFVEGAHHEEDEIQQNRDPFTSRYLRNQEESLELWTALVIHVKKVRDNDLLMACVVSCRTKPIQLKIACILDVLFRLMSLSKTSLVGTARHAPAELPNDPILRPSRTC